MQDYTIERPQVANLNFTGDLLGASNDQDQTYRIYRTKGGKFIGAVKSTPKLLFAEPFASPQDLVGWFQSRSNGQLVPLAQTAVEAASKTDESFKKFWNIHVD